MKVIVLFCILVLGSFVPHVEGGPEALWDRKYQFITPHGILVKDSMGFSQEEIATIVDKSWEWVKRCSGTEIDPRTRPLVIDYTTNLPPDYGGMIWFKGWYSYARVHPTDLWLSHFSLRHEMFHYVLRHSGEPPESNRSHKSPMWRKCAAVY